MAQCGMARMRYMTNGEKRPALRPRKKYGYAALRAFAVLRCFGTPRLAAFIGTGLMRYPNALASFPSEDIVELPSRI
jgi:hypothetical protein